MKDQTKRDETADSIPVVAMQSVGVSVVVSLQLKREVTHGGHRAPEFPVRRAVVVGEEGVKGGVFNNFAPAGLLLLSVIGHTMQARLCSKHWPSKELMI